LLGFRIYVAKTFWTSEDGGNARADRGRTWNKQASVCDVNYFCRPADLIVVDHFVSDLLTPWRQDSKTRRAQAAPPKASSAVASLPELVCLARGSAPGLSLGAGRAAT